MDDHKPSLTSEVIQMLISSVTQQGHAQLTEIEAERFLNAIARAQLGVPTGGQQLNGQKIQDNASKER
jgi:hypothetical protein